VGTEEHPTPPLSAVASAASDPLCSILLHDPPPRHLSHHVSPACHRVGAVWARAASSYDVFLVGV